MNNSHDETTIRRFLVMGCCSVLLHVIIAAIIILPGIDSEKPAKVYRVEVKYLQGKTEPPEESEPIAVVPERSVRDEPRIEPEKPKVVDLTGIVAPVLQEIAEWIEESAESVDVAEIMEPLVPLVEDAMITAGGGLGSGADTDDGGGNSLLAAGNESGWGGATTGEGWGGGSGSSGYGGGTGGGYGSGTGNSRGLAGGAPAQTGVYFAGMPGITPPIYDRTPQPTYPTASRARGEQGEVLLKVEVLANGNVGQTEIEKSSGYSLLDETALRTVKRWRFKPALKDRETVICWVNIPIRFTLK